MTTSKETAGETRSANGAATRKSERAQRPPEPPAHTEPPISWFPVIAKEEMEPEVRALIEKAEERNGFCPNVFRAYAWRPQRFLKWFAYYQDLMVGPSGLTKAEREMIAVVVSMHNRCLYCLAAHGAALRQLTGDPVLAERITLDYRRAGLAPRERAMLDYALKVTRAPEECSPEDIATLKQHGFSDADIWDIAEVAALFNLTNRVAAATGQMPNPEYHGLAR